MLGEHKKKKQLANHQPESRDLHAFLIFSQNPKWANYAGKLIKNAVYCFYKTNLTNSDFQGPKGGSLDPWSPEISAVEPEALPFCRLEP